MNRFALLVAILYFHSLCSMEHAIESDSSDDEGYIFYMDKSQSNENKEEYTIPTVAEIIDRVDHLPIELQRHIAGYLSLSGKLYQVLLDQKYFYFKNDFIPARIENISPPLISDHKEGSWFHFASCYRHKRRNNRSYGLKIVMDVVLPERVYQTHQIIILDIFKNACPIIKIEGYNVLYRDKLTQRIMSPHDNSNQNWIDIDAMLDSYESLTIRQILFLYAVLPSFFILSKKKLLLTQEGAIEVYESFDATIKKILSEKLLIKKSVKKRARKAAQAVLDRFNRR